MPPVLFYVIGIVAASDTGKQPLDGDTIEVFIGNNKEVGMVKDSEPDNNRTIVYWNFRRV